VQLATAAAIISLPQPLMSILTTVVNLHSSLKRILQIFGIICLLAVQCACAVDKGLPVSKIALLAPFEGRYREVGYNAYYAARLALQDAGHLEVDLLAVDDGGTVDSSITRAHALRQDPDVKVVLALGYAATDEQVQRAFGNLPVLVIGNWSARPINETVFILSSKEVGELTTVSPEIGVIEAARLESPVTGGEVFALEQFPLLRQSLSGVHVVSSANLPDTDFTARYKAGNQFAPEPGLLATLTYDAVGMALRGVVDGRSLAAMRYEGLNGTIRFENGYWADAPIHFYEYNSEGRLIPQS
jgi:hypothetical protein